ncbi:MAG TPA: phosphoribosylformylglycinamidine cyclo-ligase, partial [Acidobacteriota bacterium]|nr:phosphoribosylformylglycinamidine cyclo-ligase [Acidobacteriota bacterium]
MDDGQAGRSLTYREAGVDIDAANRAKKRIKELARSTFNSSVLREIGSFGGLFRPDLSRYMSPVLVSSADGVGTKLKVAFLTGIHNTVGRDLVAHCTNDILVQGAHPLFFLDYIAAGKLDAGVVESIVDGLATECRVSHCVLLGGETAEMPEFYASGEYDLAGFIVGLADEHKLYDPGRVAVGDVLIGLRSSGLHTNGYSLVRRLFFELEKWTVDRHVDEFGRTLGEEL